MLARSRPRSWSRVRPGVCQRQGFIRWGFDAAGQRAGRCWPASRLRSWPGEPLTPGGAGQLKTSIMVTVSPWCWPAVNVSGVCVCQRSRFHSWPGEPLTPGGAGQRQGFDHGHGFALVRATVRASFVGGFDAPVNRPGDACQCQDLIHGPAGQRQGFDHGRANHSRRAVLAKSRPRSWSRVRLGACHRQGFIHGLGVPGSVGASMPPVNVPGGAGQCQGLDHGRANHSRRALPASSRPRSWSRVRFGAGQQSTGRAMLASVKASTMAGRTTYAGRYLPDQYLDHGHGFALVRATVRASMPPVNRPGGASQRQDLDHGRALPASSRPRSWPGEPLTPGDACQLKTSIMVTGSPWCWPAVNRPGDAGQIKASIMVTGSLWCVPASGLHLLGLRCAGQQAGRCVPVSRP